MTIQWISGDTFTCVSTDTKPTLVPTDTKAIETNTDDVYRFNGTSWVLFSANDKTETLTNKSISGATNTLSAIPVNSLSNFSIASPLTNQIIQYNGANWVNATSSGGGSGGGFSAGGSITRSGDAVTSTFTIAHGLATPPDVYFAFPLNEAARGSITYSVDATNIILTYPVPPAEGTNNLSYVWAAGYVSAAVVALSAVSTTTLTNKSIGDLLTFVKQSPVPIDQSDAETSILYNKEIDSNNNTLAFKAQIGGSIVEVELY
jgi:hypothetical protein